MTSFIPPLKKSNPHLPFGDQRTAPWYGRDIISVKEMSRKDLEYIFGVAHEMREMVSRVGSFDLLKGKILANLFYEPSTRTSSSFTSAMERLGGSVIPINEVHYSSVAKGESLPDTIRTLECYADVIVLRHPDVGAAKTAADAARKPIINAGDGAHEHPTQALLDMMTIKAKKGKISGLKIAIVGDIAHSRVARSNIYGLTRMGAHVTVAGPATMMPRYIDRMGVRVCCRLEEAIRDADIIMMLRIQTERQQENLFPSLREYANYFCLNGENIKLAKDDVLVMHPGPINRGVEIAPEIADGPYSVILDQVTNGVAVRMALLYLLTGGK